MARTETLDDLIVARGLPLMQLAAAAGIDPKTLQGLREGRWETSRIATVTKLAKALRVDAARCQRAIAASRAAGK